MGRAALGDAARGSVAACERRVLRGIHTGWNRPARSAQRATMGPVLCAAICGYGVEDDSHVGECRVH